MFCFILFYLAESQIVCQKNVLLRWKRDGKILSLNFASLSYYGYQVVEINSNHGVYPCNAFKFVSYMDNYILFNVPVFNLNTNCSRVSLVNQFEDTNQKPLQPLPQWLETTWNVNFTQFIEFFGSNATVHLIQVQNGKPIIGNDSLLSLYFTQRSSFNIDFTKCIIILVNILNSYIFSICNRGRNIQGFNSTFSFIYCYLFIFSIFSDIFGIFFQISTFKISWNHSFCWLGSLLHFHPFKILRFLF
jgi:hypothetical protein